jgi:hypothetical protein
LAPAGAAEATRKRLTSSATVVLIPALATHLCNSGQESAA